MSVREFKRILSKGKESGVETAEINEGYRNVEIFLQNKFMIHEYVNQRFFEGQYWSALHRQEISQNTLTKLPVAVA